MQLPRHSALRTGFSLIELVVVMLIMTILAGVVAPRLGSYQERARDTRRMQDLKTVQSAVEQYKLDTGQFPAANTNSSFGGWDVSHDGDFISVLVQEGYLRAPVMDPVSDGTYHFRYYVYNKGSYGCVGADSYYVLGIRNFETQSAIDEFQGAFACTSRDWANEFAFVTGGGASYK